LFTILYSKMDWRNAMMLVVSISIVTLIAVGILKVTGLNHSIFYRPQEIFSVYDAARIHYRYEKNVNFEMTIPHGDLKAFDKRVVSEPRHVLFQTDSFGFRNAKDFHGQKYIMVGDSFVVGDGISQHNIITEQLVHYGIDSYNLAAPGRLYDYISYINDFEKTYGKEHKFVLFLYEGNDFGHARSAPVPQLTSFEKIERYIKIKLDWYKKLCGIVNTDIYRFMSTYIRRISGRKVVQKDGVEIHAINGIPVAFYKRYVSIAKRESLPLFLHFEKLLAPFSGKISHIYFIPTKYRVYYKYLHSSMAYDSNILPDRQWQYLQRVGLKLGIKTTNLTPALIKASDTLLSGHKLTYWKDDTHWNKTGISIAAKSVAGDIMLDEN